MANAVEIRAIGVDGVRGAAADSAAVLEAGGGDRGRGGLPDTKYYSPRAGRRDALSIAGSRTSRSRADRRAPQQPRVIFDPEQDDFFVLPGESLAKYTGPDRPEEGETLQRLPAFSAMNPSVELTPAEAAGGMEGHTQRMLEAAPRPRNPKRQLPNPRLSWKHWPRKPKFCRSLLPNRRRPLPWWLLAGARRRSRTGTGYRGCSCRAGIGAGRVREVGCGTG